MTRKKGRPYPAAAVLFSLILALTGCGGIADNLATADNVEAIRESTEGQEDGQTSEPVSADTTEQVTALVRAAFLNTEEASPADHTLVPAVESYTVDEDFSNVENADRYSYFLENEDFAEKLAQNGFVVDASYHSDEFFPIYESNRYGQYPNYVTVDSLMHTYHLAFALILRKTEKDYLYDALGRLSTSMFQESLSYYEELKDSEWETAAALNVMFFAVGMRLLDKEAAVPEELQASVEEQVRQIMDAQVMGPAAIMDVKMDFTQFKPRGYYEGNPLTESYFRAMMWYGQAGFPAKNEKKTTEDLTRSALLMTLAMDGSRLEEWEKIYTVTAFFAGASDDLSYYEFKPAIDYIYGEDVYVSSLVGDTEKWNAFYDLTDTLRAPVINSTQTLNDKQETPQKEFRFMGQRYTVDAEMFQTLCYDYVKENASGEKRLLPDTLDVAACMGSEEAVAILDEQKDTEYEGYTDNLALLREKFTDEEDPVWSASLYASWLHTLHPLMREKTEGYPSYMQNEQWAKKSLETFAGSYAELKHDTVLYAKQMAAEMGGGDMEVFDDRGYVEPEPEVYARFVNLSQQTCDGLKQYDMLSPENEESLNILTELGQQLLTISEKELTNEPLTDEEYELIRSYGGTLEHFWHDLATEMTGEQYVQTSEFSADTIVDIATDQENGLALEIGVGGASEIYVVVPVDGKLRIASGSVYNFYQFEQSISDRLTDSEWKQMVEDTQRPAWTESYRIDRRTY